MRTRPLPTDYMVVTPSRKAEQDFKVEYQVTSITPIYGGGVVAGVVDPAMPIRATAIRGQLRFWWRLLKKYRDPNKPLSDQALFNAERAIWGGMLGADSTANKDDGPVASQVHVHVHTVNKNVAIRSAEEQSKDSKGNPLPGVKYALFSASATTNQHSLWNPGIKFHLSLHAASNTASATDPANGLSQEQWGEVLEAVRWWANFGGIGARTRRGLGAVEVAEIEPLSLAEVERYGCSLHLQKSGSANAISAWDRAVAKLYRFRQEPGYGREKGQGNRPGRSYWPEPDSIRQLTQWTQGHPIKHAAVGRFPRAVFGLPIIFEIRGDDEPPKTSLLPVREGSSRMASPFIIKPIANGRGGYTPAVLCLPLDDLNNLALQLCVDDKEKHKLRRDVLNTFPVTLTRADEGDLSWWPVDDERQQTLGKTIAPMANFTSQGDPTPITAFLKFFES